MKMMLIHSLVFLTCLLVCECGLSPNQRVSITNSIKGQKEITSKLEGLLANPKGFAKFTDYSKKVFDFASTAIPAVGQIYDGIGFISELINGPKEDPIMLEFEKIQENFKQLDYKLDTLEREIKNEFTEERIHKYRTKVSNTLRTYNDFMNLQTDINKHHFIDACKAHRMRDVMSELAQEMTRKERSIRNLMTQNHLYERVDKYSKIVIGVFTEAMILRASCFSVSHRNEKDFDRTRKQDEDKIKEDFDTINKAIDDVLNDMKTNWKAYAVEGFEWWLNTNFQGLHSTDWKSFTNNLAEFMNEYYNPEKGNYNWGIIACGGCIVRSEEIGPEKGFLRKNLKGGQFFAVYGYPLDFTTEEYPFRDIQYSLRNHLGGYFKFNKLFNDKGVCSWQVGVNWLDGKKYPCSE